MATVDNFLRGTELIKKHVVDTVVSNYVDTRYYEDHFFKSLFSAKARIAISHRTARLEPSLPFFHRKLIDLHLPSRVVVCTGASLDEEEAYSKAYGEAIERLTTYGSLEPKNEPSHYYGRSLLNRWRYKKFPYAEIHWGTFSGFRKTGAVTTSGCAGGFTQNDAVVSGWLELIERDSFFVYWLNTLTPQKIAVQEYVDGLQNRDPVSWTSKQLHLIALVKKLKKHNVSFEFLDITTDIGVPAVCCVLSIRADGQTQYVVGAASGFSPESTLLSASMEALSGLHRRSFLPRYRLPEDFKPFADSRVGIEERIAIYQHEEYNQHFEFLVSSQKKIPVQQWCGASDTDSTEDHLRVLQEIFRKRMKSDPDYDVFSYRYHNKLLASLNYTVVRVMCNGLFPIYLHEHLATPNHPRLRKAAYAMGRESEACLNQWPHPFP
jgi:thiazole/oxazole-forming peptide maturase SagD family component